MILVTQVLWKRILMHESDYLLVFLMLEAYNSFLFSVCSCYKLSYLLVNSPTFSFSIRLWVPCCQLSPKFQASSYTALALHFWTRGLWIHGRFFRVSCSCSFLYPLSLRPVFSGCGPRSCSVCGCCFGPLVSLPLVSRSLAWQGGRNFRPFPVASSFCLSCMRVRVCVCVCVCACVCARVRVFVFDL